MSIESLTAQLKQESAARQRNLAARYAFPPEFTWTIQRLADPEESAPSDPCVGYDAVVANLKAAGLDESAIGGTYRIYLDEIGFDGQPVHKLLQWGHLR